MMIQMDDRPNTTPIGQDKETLSFKALLYLNVAVQPQVCTHFCVVDIPLFSLVQLGYPATYEYYLLTRQFVTTGCSLYRRPRYNEQFFR